MVSFLSMRVLFTGASSKIGAAVLTRLLETTDWEFVCTRHRGTIGVVNARVSVIEMDLLDESASLPKSLDLVIHFAGLTHSNDESAYWRVNLDGTQRLAARARENGCERFVYISTRCATLGSGAYGESKLAAENALREAGFSDLLIIRPSEVYGVGSGEGIDRFIGLARSKRIAPALIGAERIRFSPLNVDDLVLRTAALIASQAPGEHVVEMCGPEELSGSELASRLADRFGAIRIPIWLPALRIAAGLARIAGIGIASPDQFERLLCEKTCRVSNDDGLKRFFSE